MSREAWGDEGNVPIDGYDTTCYHDFIDIKQKFRAWVDRNKDVLDENATNKEIDGIDYFLDELSEKLPGLLTP